jgi:hypothetical protein
MLSQRPIILQVYHTCARNTTEKIRLVLPCSETVLDMQFLLALNVPQGYLVFLNIKNHAIQYINVVRDFINPYFIFPLVHP